MVSLFYSLEPLEVGEPGRVRWLSRERCLWYKPSDLRWSVKAEGKTNSADSPDPSMHLGTCPTASGPIKNTIQQLLFQSELAKESPTNCVRYQSLKPDPPSCLQAQALLRWHDGHQFCSKSGQPTQKNMAGSKRVCPSNNIIYYPQVGTREGGTNPKSQSLEG